MQHVIVKLWPGKSEKQKAQLAERISQAVMDILNYGEESVSVARDWGKHVYEPDIKAKWDKLYKKPGYEM